MGPMVPTGRFLQKGTKVTKGEGSYGRALFLDGGIILRLLRALC
jgi:hypothetical protein